MYESKTKYYYGTGRRKHSVARVRVYPGSGNITINGRNIDEYFGLETLKLIVRQPLNLTDTSDKFDNMHSYRRRCNRSGWCNQTRPFKSASCLRS